MKQTFNAIMIHPGDNVVTGTQKLREGDEVRYLKGEELCTLITGGAPLYHKVAATDIAKGQPIRKYGEVMAVATEDIPKGAHVHTHNAASPAHQRN